MLSQPNGAVVESRFGEVESFSLGGVICGLWFLGSSGFLC